MMNRLILIILLAFTTHINTMAQRGKYPLRDSLMDYYGLSVDEIMAIDPPVLSNMVRKMKGQDTLKIHRPKPFVAPTIDKYGGQLQTWTESQIDSQVELARRQYVDFVRDSSSYRKHIFPNAYSDSFYFLSQEGFYSNPMTRELYDSNYMEAQYSYGGGDGFDPNYLLNQTRRIYYLDSNDNVKGVLLQGQEDINEGWKYSEEFSPDGFRPNLYQILIVAISDSSYILEDYSDTQSLPYRLPNETPTPEERWSSPFRIKVDRYYISDNDVIYKEIKRATAIQGQIRQAIEATALKPFKLSYYKYDQKWSYYARNPFLEYTEWKEGTNDYLKPGRASQLTEPYFEGDPLPRNPIVGRKARSK